MVKQNKNRIRYEELKRAPGIGFSVDNGKRAIIVEADSEREIEWVKKLIEKLNK